MRTAAQRQPIAPPVPELARLNLFALFHLNLAFSSIEESDRAAVIERCYWPLLALCAAHGPIGIEASGYTLEQIEMRDPAWIRRLGDLIADGKAELIGSGYAQLIGPLAPATLVAKNLGIGNAVYRQLLGTSPTLALVNEQAYAGGLVGHYLDAGYKALLMDWDNPAAQHPEWSAESRYLPQTARGADGRTIGLLWTNTVAFQKLQRYAHGDMEFEDYLDFVLAQQGASPRALCVYASDGEIFGFRPGRYRTEERLEDGEWTRLGAAFSALSSERGMRLVTPSGALTAMKNPGAEPLRLETAACPVPVKKQRKYNLTRWAVTGRDDIAINAACQRIHAALLRGHAPETDWKTLCRLWASDFRTHITQARWDAYCAELSAMEARLGTSPTLSPPKAHPPECAARITGVERRFIDIETRSVRVRLDRRRGLAIARVAFDGDAPIIGGLPHGHFDDIALQADWYTGDCVFEEPGEPKITDLDWAETELWHEDGDVLVCGRIQTPLGPIEKTLRVSANEPRIGFDMTFHWSEWRKGALRLGHITLLPEAFDWQSLALTTHNGGFAPERFALSGTQIDHGAPVSFLVSASCGLGMTEGWAELSDGKRTVRVEVEREIAPLLGLLTHRQMGGSLFCQLALSMLELDDTRRPAPYLPGPRRVRFSILGVTQTLP
ncbi:MAG TPA: hypothetical protein VGM72_07235 [Micropepsaceae bacterium]